jgi:hypothetical protein
MHCRLQRCHSNRLCKHRHIGSAASDRSSYSAARCTLFLSRCSRAAPANKIRDLLPMRSKKWCLVATAWRSSFAVWLRHETDPQDHHGPCRGFGYWSSFTSVSSYKLLDLSISYRIQFVENTLYTSILNRLLLFIFLPFAFPWSFDLQRGHVFYLPLT